MSACADAFPRFASGESLLFDPADDWSRLVPRRDTRRFRCDEAIRLAQRNADGAPVVGGRCPGGRLLPDAADLDRVEVDVGAGLGERFRVEAYVAGGMEVACVVATDS